MTAEASRARVPTGVPGLDEVLRGGLPAGTLFLAQGAPGTGKTTLGMQFLLEGVRRGESCLLVSNSESDRDLATVAAAHGWDLRGIAVVRWEDPAAADAAGEDYTLFPPAEVEVGETLAHVLGEVERRRPDRLVVDSISGLRMAAREPVHYRRQLQRFADFLGSRACTSVFLDDAVEGELDVRTQTVAHGFLQLEHLALHYGGERRRLCVRKLRGCEYVGGYHDFTIATGGLQVYPRLVAARHERVAEESPAESGVAALDALAGGGLPRGSSTLLMGPAGSGKSTIGSVYLQAAAVRGERSAVYLFDESERSYRARGDGLGLDLGRHLESGRILATRVDPAELSPGQMAHRIVRQVESEGVRLVVLDTLNGYLQGTVQEQMVTLHLRELLSYLARRGVVTLLALTQHGIFGAEMATPLDVSFLADNVILLRYFELQGGIRVAISMVKRRTGCHERTIRELRLEQGQIHLSAPLTAFARVLGGDPVYRGSGAPLGSGEQ